MKKVTVVVLAIIFAMTMVSCDFLKQLLENLDKSIPGQDQFEDTDGDEVLTNFFDGTFKDKIFSGQGNFRYKLDYKSTDNVFLLDLYTNLSFNSFLEQKDKIDAGNYPQDAKISGIYNMKTDYLDAESTIYFSQGKGYMDLKKYQSDAGDPVAPGKYKDFEDAIYSFLHFDFDSVDIMNLACKSEAVNAQTVAPFIDSIKKAEKNGNIFYEIILNEDGLEAIDEVHFFDNHIEVADFDIRIVYTLKDNDIVGFDFIAQNKTDENHTLTLSALKVETSLQLPDFSIFTNSYPF